MGKIDVGRDIDCRCTRCKMELAHTIIAMVNGVPARVKCNTCHSERKYRAPKRAGKTTTKRRTTTTTKARATRKASAYEKEEQWSALMNKAQAEGRDGLDYSMRETFEKGQLVVHKKFGAGFVMGALGATKIRVCFRDGERVLVHAR